MDFESRRRCRGKRLFGTDRLNTFLSIYKSELNGQSKQELRGLRGSLIERREETVYEHREEEGDRNENDVSVVQTHNCEPPLANLPHLFLLELVHTASSALARVNLVSFNVLSVPNADRVESLLLESLESS